MVYQARRSGRALKVTQELLHMVHPLDMTQIDIVHWCESFLIVLF